MKLAPYATIPEHSRGRLYKEAHENKEDAFALDRRRIVHSSAFRRLDYKTQVFVNHVGDHYRTRMTHSLEVSQIARNIARQLNLNEDLTETIALSHDLGHPPFGHAGEDGLRIAKHKFYDFDHNLQAIKIVTQLEEEHIKFKGLNLSAETLEGLIKHNGPLNESDSTIAAKVLRDFLIPLTTQASLEAQVAALADDIAYCNHDLDDAIRAKFISIKDVLSLPYVGEIFNKVEREHPTISARKLVKESIRRISALMVNDVVKNTLNMIDDNKIETAHDVFSKNMAIVSLSKEFEEVKNLLKAFLFEKCYRHYSINRMSSKAKHVVQSLFEKLYECPECLPTKWYQLCKKEGMENRASIIVDYIAGMTDRYAIEEYGKLFDPKLF